MREWVSEPPTAGCALTMPAALGLERPQHPEQLCHRSGRTEKPGASVNYTLPVREQWSCAKPRCMGRSRRFAEARLPEGMKQYIRRHAGVLQTTAETDN